jgi:hypothetical protein
MSGGALIAAEALLVIGGLAAFVVWQMRDLKKARREREAKERSGERPHG